MKKNKFKLLLLFIGLVAITGTTLSSCKDKDDDEKCQVCGVDNPLTDILWLKKYKTEMDTSTTKARIYTCTYQTNKQGFLIENCIDCPDAGVMLMDCEGNNLCVLNGITGNNCQEYSIDTNSIQIIYQNFNK
ncbi:MAG: hypothetical protein LKE30_05935 [Bacteroidales bacterium]|jgi:hypothetical protein|nr:hypothetical protein [Bacteroidales bacterium]